MPARVETGEKPFNQPQDKVAICRRLRTFFILVSSNGEISRFGPPFGLSLESQAAERRPKRIFRGYRYEKA